MTSVPIEPQDVLISEGWVDICRGQVAGLLFRRNSATNQRLVITFDALSSFNHRRKSVTGQKLIGECNADHMHFAYADVAWYQTVEIFDILRAASHIVARYKDVVLLGHSMGGYAALLFSGALRASRVIAFAPQYSVDQSKTAFETRFQSYVQGRAFVYDDMSIGLSKTSDNYVVYDPLFRVDAEHVRLLEKAGPLVLVKLPFSGHYPGDFLNECGLLGRLTRSLITGSFSHEEMRQIVRRCRRKSSRYFCELAVALGRRRRLRSAIEAVNRAYVLTPKSTSVLETYQAILQTDSTMYGLAHAMTRLIAHEQPSWTHYQQTMDLTWRELRVNYELKDDSEVSCPST